MKSKIEMVFLKDVAEIKFCIVGTVKGKNQSEKTKWLTAANLLNDNIITKVLEEDKYKKDEALQVFKDDIVIKRISPTYINYVNNDLPDTYAYNNLIIVRPKDINEKYLASVLSYEIQELSINASVGAVMPSIGRTELEGLKIPICSSKEQVLIGEIWFKSIEKKKMLRWLAELQNTREIYLINKFIKNNIGGKQL